MRGEKKEGGEPVGIPEGKGSIMEGISTRGLAGPILRK